MAGNAVVGGPVATLAEEESVLGGRTQEELTSWGHGQARSCTCAQCHLFYLYFTLIKSNKHRARDQESI